VETLSIDPAGVLVESEFWIGTKSDECLEP